MSNANFDDRELNFLVLHYLRNRLSANTALNLESELKNSNLLPKRVDWTGNETNLDYDELARKYAHITPEHLPVLLQRLIESAIPRLPQLPVATLTGHDIFDLTKSTRSDVLAASPMQVVPATKGTDPASAIVPINETSDTKRKRILDAIESRLPSFRQRLPKDLSSNPIQVQDEIMDQFESMSLEERTALLKRFSSNRYLVAKIPRQKFNLFNIMQGRQITTRVPQGDWPPQLTYARYKRIKMSKGHIMPAYCLIFDKTGDRMFTGSDDKLVKVWSTITGDLLHTLRGHAADITDLSVNEDNTLLVSSGNDHMIRVWSLEDYCPVAILIGHADAISNVSFCPKPGVHRILSISYDGTVRLWNTDDFAQPSVSLEAGGSLCCSAWSPGGTWFVTGVADCTARIWSVDPPKLIQILRGHRAVVNTIGWSHSGTKIITGSTDGTARVWDFDPKYKFWVCKHVLVMNPNEKKTTSQSQVSMLQWSLDDRYILTAIQNSEMKVWNAETGQLVHVLKAHSRQIFVLDTHPTDPRIMLSAGYDGMVILWNIETGQPIKVFTEDEHTMTDGGFSPNGAFFGVTDIEGYFCLYGTGSGDLLKKAPMEQFFSNDYAPLMRDEHGYVIDEEYQIAPHLIPKRPLCDSYNRPHIDQPRIERMAYTNSHKYERAILEKVRKHREAMAEIENSLSVVLSDNPMPFPEEMPVEPPPQNRRRRDRPLADPFQAVPIPEDLLQGSISESEEDEEDDDAFEEAERDGVRRSSRLKTQRKLRKRLRNRSARIRTRSGAGENKSGEEKSQEGNEEMEFADSEYEISSDESNEDEMSFDSNDSAFEDDARAVRRERRARAGEVVEDRSSRRSRRSAVDMGDRVRTKKLEKHKRKLSSYPPWLTQTIPHSLIGSYSPQLRDRVVYFRQGHESYLNEFIEFNNLVPSEVPEVCYCTVKAIIFKVDPFIHCELLLETVMETDLREEYPIYSAQKPAAVTNNNTNVNMDIAAPNSETVETSTNNNINNNNVDGDKNEGQSENEKKSKVVITSPIATRSQRFKSDEDIVEKARRLSLLDVIRSMQHNNRITAYNKTVKTKVEFKVQYHATELPDFLILASRFDQALSVDWQVGNRFRTWMFFQESDQTKLGAWYQGTIVDLSLNTLKPKKKSKERRSLNNNSNNIEELKLTEDVPMTDTAHVVDENNVLGSVENSIGPLALNNVNTNNVEKDVGPGQAMQIEEKIADPEPKTFVDQQLPSEDATSVLNAMSIEEKEQKSTEEKSQVSSGKIRLRPGKEEKSAGNDEISVGNQGIDIELINPWEMLVIKWDEDEDEDEEDHMSPWEVEQLDDAGNKKKTFTIESIDPDIAGLIILEVQERILTMDEVDAFVEPVDVGLYDDYPEFVPCPMDVSTICDRLRNNYYRSIEQLKFEIQMIEGNAALYNEENSILVTYAKIIVRKFLDIIRHFEESLSLTASGTIVNPSENNTNVMENNTNVLEQKAGGISIVRVIPDDLAYEALINKKVTRRRTRKQRAENPEETARENARESRRESQAQTVEREERRTRAAASRQLRQFTENEGSEGDEGSEDRDNDFDEDDASIDDADDDDMDDDAFSDDEDGGRIRRNQQRRRAGQNNNSNDNRNRSVGTRRALRSQENHSTANPYAQRYDYSDGNNIYGFNDYRSTRSSSRIQRIQSERRQQPASRPSARVRTRSQESFINSANNTINNYNSTNNNEGPRIRTLNDRPSSNNNNNNRRITVRNLRSGRVLNEQENNNTSFPSIRRDPTNPLVLRFNSQRQVAQEAGLGVNGRRTRNSLSASLDTNFNTNMRGDDEDEEDQEDEGDEDSGSEFESGGRSARMSSSSRPTRISSRRAESQEDQDDGVRRSSRKRKANTMLESEDFLQDNEESSSTNDPNKRRSGRLREKDFIKKSIDVAYPPTQEDEEEYHAHVTTRRRAESLIKEKSSEIKSESEEIKQRATRSHGGKVKYAAEEPYESEEQNEQPESGFVPEEKEPQTDFAAEQPEINNNNNNMVPFMNEEAPIALLKENQTSSDTPELDPSLVQYFASKIKFVLPSAEKPKTRAATKKRKRDSEEEEDYSVETKRTPARSTKRRKISDEEEEDEDEDFSESFDERPKKRQARAAPKSKNKAGNSRRFSATRRKTRNNFDDDDEDEMSDEPDDDDYY